MSRTYDDWLEEPYQRYWRQAEEAQERMDDLAAVIADAWLLTDDDLAFLLAAKTKDLTAAERWAQEFAEDLVLADCQSLTAARAAIIAAMHTYAAGFSAAALTSRGDESCLT